MKMTRMTFKGVIFCMTACFLIGHAGVTIADSIDEKEISSAPAPVRVTLEVNAVQIVLNDEHRQGVDWEAIVSDFHTLQLKKEEQMLWDDNRFPVSIGTVSEEDYAVLLDALDTVGKMGQFAQPPMDLAKAKNQNIDITFGSGKTAVDIRLKAVWTNSAKTGPLLYIEPQLGVLRKEDGRPVAVTLKGRTKVALQERSTIVIGSIFSEQEITKTHKFPLLGDLPLVGLVFRNQGRWVEKTETIIFLTPLVSWTEEPAPSDKG